MENQHTYIANPVRVTALRIVGVMPIDRTIGTILSLEDGSEFEADHTMTARYVPQPGDYLVRQEDGYAYLNPREVFERKYRPADAKVLFAPDREIVGFLRDVSDRVVQRGEKAEHCVVIVGNPYGGKLYTEATVGGIEALGLIDLGHEVMKRAIIAGDTQ